jgi:hypothetical protein
MVPKVHLASISRHITHNRIGPCADDIRAAILSDAFEHGTLMARLFPVSPLPIDQSTQLRSESTASGRINHARTVISY